MTRVTLWSSSAGDVPANLAFVNNFDAITNPGVTNDIAHGYTRGSVWINTITDEAFLCTDHTTGAALWELMTTGSGTPGQLVAPAAATPTGAGSDASVIGGAGGATSGNGGAAKLTGGAGTAGNASGGSVVLAGGAPNGSGNAGGIRLEGVVIQKQPAPAAKTVSTTLTAAELLSGIITVTNSSASALQVPTGTALQNALPADMAVDDSFDVSFINLGSATGIATLTVNTDITIVGNAAVPVPTAGTESSAIFRFRKTADHVFVAYRIV
jgi:hypothetical protein